MSLAVSTQDVEELNRVREEITLEQRRELLAEVIYLAWRSNKKKELAFLKDQMCSEEKKGLRVLVMVYAAKRLKNKITGVCPNERLRGYVR